MHTDGVKPLSAKLQADIGKRTSSGLAGLVIMRQVPNEDTWNDRLCPLQSLLLVRIRVPEELARVLGNEGCVVSRILEAGVEQTMWEEMLVGLDAYTSYMRQSAGRFLDRGVSRGCLHDDLGSL